MFCGLGRLRVSSWRRAKTVFFMVLGLRQGSGTENWRSCRLWCQHRANIGQDVGYMGQHKAKIGASLRQHRANIGQDVGQMGPHRAKIGPSLRQHRANIGQDVGQMGPHRAKIGPTWGHMGPYKARLGPTWAMIGANLRHQRANIGQGGPT